MRGPRGKCSDRRSVTGTGWELGVRAADSVQWWGTCVHECKQIHLCLSGGSLFIMLCASPCWRLWPTLWNLTTCLARSSRLAIQTPTRVIRKWLGISLSQRDFGSSFTSCTSTWNPPTFVNMTMWRWDPRYFLTRPRSLLENLLGVREA